jgi:hypothetical protein
MSSPLSVENQVRLLRAKAADLENRVLQATESYGPPLRPVDEAKADIALIATLLADHIEQCHEHAP